MKYTRRHAARVHIAESNKSHGKENAFRGESDDIKDVDPLNLYPENKTVLEERSVIDKIKTKTETKVESCCSGF